MKFLNTLNTFLLITLSVQIGSAEIFDKKSLVNRYREASEETISTHKNVAITEGIVGTSGIAAAATVSAVSGSRKALAASREIAPLTDAIYLMTQIANDRIIIQKETAQVSETLTADKVDEINALNPNISDAARRIEANELRLSSLRNSRTYTDKLDELDRSLLSADEIKIDEFLDKAQSLTTEERTLIERAQKNGRGKLKKVIIGGVAFIVLVNGASRYLIANEGRDPTVAPLGGVLAWVAGESGEAAVAVKDGSVEFVTKTVPEKINQAHNAVVNKFKAVRSGAEEEIEKVEETLRDPSSDKN